MDWLSNDNLLCKSAKDHLRNVYSTIAICMLAAAAGAHIHFVFVLLNFGLLSSFFISLVLSVLVKRTPHDSSNHTTSLIRFGYLLGCAFFHGILMRRLISFAIAFFSTYGIGNGQLNEKILCNVPCIFSTLFIGNSVILLCFSLSSLLASDLRYLYFSAFLMSALALTPVLSLLDLLLRSHMICHISSCGRLVQVIAVCGYISYNTRCIVEKREMGDDDYVLHYDRQESSLANPHGVQQRYQSTSADNKFSLQYISELTIIIVNTDKSVQVLRMEGLILRKMFGV